MKTITFPDSESLSSNYSCFSLESVVLVALNKFIKNLFFNFSAGIDVKGIQKASYKYNFSRFEIEELSLLDDDKLSDILTSYHYSVPYNFYLEALKIRVSGVFDIDLKFINKSVFEKSYFDINILLESESDFNKVFENVDLSNFYKSFFEFQNLLWGRVYGKIRKPEIVNRIGFESDCEYAFFAPISLKNNSLLQSDLPVNKSIPDTYHILTDLFLNFKSDKNYILISADDVLAYRKVKKNINSNGYRSGYKEEQKKKIKEDIALLSYLGAIFAIFISDDLYCVSLDLSFDSVYAVPRKILEYSQKTELLEKFAAEFLYFISSLDNKSKISVKVNDLVKIVRQNLKSDRLSILRDRLEKALDNLQNDNIIKSWAYKNINETEIRHISDYQKLKILVEL